MIAKIPKIANIATFAKISNNVEIFKVNKIAKNIKRAMSA